MKRLTVCFLTAVLGVGCKDSSNTQPAPVMGGEEPSDEIKGDPKEMLAALRQLGTAFHDYESRHRALPAAAILGKDGRPLLSWRVAILPHIKEANLYQQF